MICMLFDTRAVKVVYVTAVNKALHRLKSLSSDAEFFRKKMTNRLIWFLLVDSAGQPYKSATVSAVSLPADSVVDQFRDAVKAKYDQASYLKDLPSSALQVYCKNQFYDAKNNREEAQSLEEDSSISDRGKSKKEALIVVVPDVIQSFEDQSLYFKPCEIPFFKSICSASEIDGWISLGQEVSSTNLNMFYIRESYRAIAQSIKSGRNKVIITGTPGIGKSIFIIYLFWKLVKEGKRVLFIYHPDQVYYDGNGGLFYVNTIPSSGDRVFWNDTLWCLFDAKSKEAKDLNALPYELCTFVLSTSPRREMLNDFRKPPVPQVFYMPLWTKAELEKIAPLFPNANEWPYRFEILGGIPRRVLEDTSRNPTEILEEACSDCTL